MRQAAGVDARPQHPPGGGGELQQAPVGQLGDRRERILAEPPQHLGPHDVADARQHALVEQQLGDRAVDRAGAAQVGGGVEAGAEQVGAEPEAEVAAPAHLDLARPEDDHIGRGGAHDVAAAAGARRGQAHPPVHPQVNVQAAAVRAVDEQVLAAGLDRGDVRPRERAGGDTLPDDGADPARCEDERVPLRHAAPAAGAP